MKVGWDAAMQSLFFENKVTYAGSIQWRLGGILSTEFVDMNL